MRKSLFILFICTGLVGFSQGLDTLKVMSYNLLKFPSIAPERIDTLEDILAYVKPDILMVCELSNGEGANAILFDALNEGGESDYDMADFVDGPDTQNLVYFNSEKLALYDQNIIPTDLRDINEYVLYYKSDNLATTDTVFFYIYVCHLKASTGFEAQRNGEVQELKTWLANKAYTENIIIGGDFNFYGSETEPGWNTLLNGEGVEIKDPLNLPGNWHTDSDFAWAHTQSTRTTAFGGGATGGMDDRFDFIFIGKDLQTFENHARYIEGSYRAIGQDGLHYNDALVDEPENTSEPASIISKLYHMSDHLPIYMEIELASENASLPNQNSVQLKAIYDRAGAEIILTGPLMESGITGSFSIVSTSGQLMREIPATMIAYSISVASLKQGAYILKHSDSDFVYRFIKL